MRIAMAKPGSAFLRDNGSWILFISLALLATILTGGDFLAPRNLTNLMRQASINGVLASGMMFIIVHGGIDLSIGAVVALAGVVVGVSQVSWGWSALGAQGAAMSGLLALAVGLGAGLINGAVIASLGVAPFMITLGMMVITRGLALIVAGGGTISPMSEQVASLADSYLPVPLSALLAAFGLGWFAFDQLRQDVAGDRRNALLPIAVTTLIAVAFCRFRGIPTLTLFMVLALAGAAFVLTRTTFGRAIYAIGSNERAALWAGVPVRKVIWSAYALMGGLAGLSGLLLSARLGGADPNAGQLFELDAIASVVIGGTSLKGGSGSVAGTFVGALTIATLNNGMDLLDVTSFYQMVFKGLIIVGAGAWSYLRSRSQ